MKYRSSKRSNKIKKLQNILYFFQTTLTVNVGLSLAAFALGSAEHFIITFLGVGFASSLAVKEISNKQFYLFYHNNGISKAVLVISSYFITVAVAFLMWITFILIQSNFD